MNPILFAKNETVFTTNGLGRLQCLSCEVTEERNGMLELEATLLISSPHADEIEQLSIIGAKAHDGGDIQAFYVYKITKPINGRFTVYARHISYRLSDIPCMPFTIESGPNACAQALAGLKSHATEPCPFNFYTDKTTVAPYKQSIPASIRQRLGGIEGSVLDQFGGEYEWDNFDVHLWNKRGRVFETTGISLRYGKNITDIEQEEAIANTVTGVVPYWIDTDGTNLVVLPDDQETPNHAMYSDNAGNYPYHLVQVLDLSSHFEEKPTVAQLKSVAYAYVHKDGFGEPKVSIKTSFVNLWETEEYKDIAPLEHVKLCDEVQVYFEQLDINVIAKVVKTKFDVLEERYNSVEIGTIRTSLAQTVTDRNKNIDTMFIDQMTRVDTAITNKTSWLTAANGYVVARLNQDGSWKELLFMDTNDPTTARNGLRINNLGIGIWSYAVSGGNVLDGPYDTSWTISGRIGDAVGKNFWNLLTGEFSLSSTATVGGKTVSQIADDAADVVDAKYAQEVLNINADIADLQDQIDGNITSWFYSYAPTTSNAPASSWTTLDDKINHIGDLFYDSTTGYCYRWQIKSTAADPSHPTANDFEWVQLSDSDIAAALAAANQAQDTADHKRRVFVTTPTPPYDVGDLWTQGSTGDLMRCKTAKTATQTYSASDWELASKSLVAFDQALNQRETLKRLTDNFRCRGIYLQNNSQGDPELYIRADYVVLGILADAYGKNFWNLETGDFMMTAGAKLYYNNPTYTGAYVPTIENSPASMWSDFSSHLGETFKNTAPDPDTFYIFTETRNSLKLTFNSNSNTEADWDYLLVIYKDGNNYYSRKLTGAIGAQVIYLPDKEFWLLWHTDSSVHDRYGWKIDSISVVSYQDPSGFSSIGTSLPSYTGFELVGGAPAPIESSHNPYEDNLDYMYIVDLDVEMGYDWRQATIEELATAKSLKAISDITPEEAFETLTDNGRIQGLIMQNGALYVSAAYIGAGVLKIGGPYYNNNPRIEVYDTSNQLKGKWDKDGIEVNKGKFGLLSILSDSSSIEAIGSRYMKTFTIPKSNKQKERKYRFVIGEKYFVSNFTLHFSAPQIIDAGSADTSSTIGQVAVSGLKLNSSGKWEITYTFATIMFSGDDTIGDILVDWQTKGFSETDKIQISFINQPSNACKYKVEVTAINTVTLLLSANKNIGDFKGGFTGTFDGSVNDWDWNNEAGRMETDGNGGFTNYFGKDDFGLGSNDGGYNSLLRWIPEEGRLLLRQAFSTSDDRGLIVSNYDPSDTASNGFNAGGAYYTVIKADEVTCKKNGSGSNNVSSMNTTRFYVSNGSNYAHLQNDLLHLSYGNGFYYSKLFGYGMLDMYYSQRMQLSDTALHFRFGDSNKYARLSADDSAEELTLQYNSGRKIYMTANADEATLRVCSNFSSRWMYLVSNPNTQDVVRYSGSYQSVEWNTSDRRAKEDIEDLDVELSLSIIDATEPKRFKYKGMDGIHYGAIAQDMREVLDNLGETEAQLEHSMGITGPDAVMEDQRTIDYHEYTALLINYVKFLRAENSQRKQEIEELRGEIKVLKDLLCTDDAK